MKKLPEEVSQWISFAEEDLRAARVLVREKIYNQACFHCQQSAEKMFKAALLSGGKGSPKVHDLNELFEKAVQSGILFLLPWRERMATLSLYYVPTRYPDAVIGSLPDGLPNKKDAEEALSIAEFFYADFRKFLKGRSIS